MEIDAKILKSKEDKPKDAYALSVSKAKTYDSCQAKFHYCYIEKLPRKDWDFHIFGKFNHEVLENFHNKLLEDPNLDFNKLMTECFKISIDNWKGKITKQQLLDSKKIQGQYLDLINKQKKDGTLPKVVGVEKDFNILINNKVLLNGFIDRVQIDIDGMLHVADYKTTKDLKYQKDYFQLLTYAYVLMVEDPTIETIRASYIMLRHNFKFITKTYKRDEVMKISKDFLDYEKKISEERLWRAEPQFLCKYCDYVDHCSPGKEYLIKIGINSDDQKSGKISW